MNRRKARNKKRKNPPFRTSLVIFKCTASSSLLPLIIDDVFWQPANGLLQQRPLLLFCWMEELDSVS